MMGEKVKGIQHMPELSGSACDFASVSVSGVDPFRGERGLKVSFPGYEQPNRGQIWFPSMGFDALFEIIERHSK